MHFVDQLEEARVFNGAMVAKARGAISSILVIYDFSVFAAIGDSAAAETCFAPSSTLNQRRRASSSTCRTLSRRLVRYVRRSPPCRYLPLSRGASRTLGPDILA